MHIGATIFLGVILAVFAVLDGFMLVSLLKPGDERNQIIVWKASSFTLLAVVGANILDVGGEPGPGAAHGAEFHGAAGSRRHCVFWIPFVLQKKARWLKWKTGSGSGERNWASRRRELAKKCGVSRQTVNAIENQKYDPTLSLAFRLAKELQLTVDALFTPCE